jgi:AcrR family transcriptional regulator
MKTRKAVLKREKIVAAAAKVFNSKGYAAVTMADVAAEAETFAGSLYYYFSCKDDLVEEVLDLGITQLAEIVANTVGALPPETPPIERLKAAIRAHFFAALQRDDFVMAYWKIADQVPDQIRERHFDRQRAYGRFWHELIEQAQRDGAVRPDLDARIVSLILIGGRLFALSWFNEKGSPTTAEISEIFVRMTLQGIATDEALHEQAPDTVAAAKTKVRKPRATPRKTGQASIAGL